MSLSHSFDDRGHEDVSDAESELDLSRRVNEQGRRPASIDMALSLERELDDEHDEHDEHDHDRKHGEASIPREVRNGNGAEEGLSSSTVDDPDTENRRVSLDPHVLQRIVANLRAELDSVTREREALAESLAGGPTREAELREALSLLTERSTALEAEVEQLRRKSQEDDESIQMLRTKLEESRRALMRLQTESKRMSQMSHASIDTSRANSLFGGGPSSSKRASFTPLTGSGVTRMANHRRISSVSEPSFGADMGEEPTSPSAAGRTISWPEEDAVAAKKSRRSSAFFGGLPAPMAFTRSATPSPPTHQRQLAPDADTGVLNLDALRKERDSARAELAAARQELTEAQEAREASEQCVSALRAFISAQAANDSSDGVNSSAGILKLPPLPTEKNVDFDPATQQTPTKRARPAVAAGWSFGKLFRGDSTGSASSEAESRGTSPPSDVGGVGTRATSNTPSPAITTSTPGASGNEQSNHTPSPSTATPGGAFSRTFGGFFSGRAPSISSIAAVTSSNAKDNDQSKERFIRPPTAHGQQEPTLNGMGSDEEGDDSVDEPPEPTSPDASSRSADDEIWVRNASSAGSEAGVGDAALLTLKGKEASETDIPVQVGSAA